MFVECFSRKCVLHAVFILISVLRALQFMRPKNDVDEAQCGQKFKNLSVPLLFCMAFDQLLPIQSERGHIREGAFIGFYNAITPNNCFVMGSHKYDVYLVEENKTHLNWPNKDRSVCVAERLALPTSVHGVMGSNPAGGEILPEPKRRFIACKWHQWNIDYVHNLNINSKEERSVNWDWLHLFCDERYSWAKWWKNMPSICRTRKNANSAIEAIKILESSNIYGNCIVLYYLRFKSQRFRSDCMDAQADLCLCCSHMSHVMRKPVYAICEQQRRRSVCAFAQSNQCLYCSLPPLLAIAEISRT